VLPYALIPPLAMGALAPVLVGATATAEARDVFRAPRARQVAATIVAVAAALGALRFLADVAAIAV
jgi:hypothetical protein